MASYFSEKNLLDFDPNSSKADIKEGLTVTGSGKGDGTRPSRISKREYARNYCRTFGHKRLVTPEGEYGYWLCLDCGERGRLPHPADCPAPSCNPAF
jgi:hypothetical protein